MQETLTRYWWAVVLRGVAAVLFGLLALIWPDITVFVLVILFGAYALADGVLALIAAAMGENVAVAGGSSSKASPVCSPASSPSFGPGQPRWLCCT